MNMMKNDSFSSYNHTADFEEMKNRSKSNIGDRELDFKNSFHEWGMCSAPMNTLSNHQRSSMPDTPLNIQRVNAFNMNHSEQAIKEETSS